MATEKQMRLPMQADIDRFNTRAGEGAAGPFADNARIKDPVGGRMIAERRAAMDEFYRTAVTIVASVRVGLRWDTASRLLRRMSPALSGGERFAQIMRRPA